MTRVAGRSVIILAVGYWSTLVILGFLAYFVFPESSWVSIPIFWALMICLWLVSFLLSGASLNKWYENVFLYGVRKLARSMSVLSLSK